MKKHYIKLIERVGKNSTMVLVLIVLVSAAYSLFFYVFRDVLFNNLYELLTLVVMVWSAAVFLSAVTMSIKHTVNNTERFDKLKTKMLQNNDDKMDVILNNHHILKHDSSHVCIKNKNKKTTEIESINKKLAEKDKQYEDLIREEQDALLKQKGQKNILELMLDNMGEIRDYFSISKLHAKLSFGLAILNCLVGIVLFGVAVFFALTDPNNIQPAIIAAVAGGISELFAATSLVVHKKSLTQLNHYYSALNENEMFLSTVNLVGNLSIEVQDNMYVKIIKNELAVRRSRISDSKIDESK